MNIENEPAAKEAEPLTGDALTIAFLKANLEDLRTGGIVTVAMTNPNVMSYMEHWEGRAEKAEKRVEELEATLRAHNSDSAEPVATMHVSESETLFSKGYDGKGLMGFTSKPLYLASPPSKEVEITEDRIEQIARSYHDRTGDRETVDWDKCKSRYRTQVRKMVRNVLGCAALTNRTPDDEVGNG